VLIAKNIKSVSSKKVLKTSAPLNARKNTTTTTFQLSSRTYRRNSTVWWLKASPALNAVKGLRLCNAPTFGVSDQPLE